MNELFHWYMDQTEVIDLLLVLLGVGSILWLRKRNNDGIETTDGTGHATE